ELGTRFSEKARLGLTAILNYVGGAYIYIRREYASRIRLIQRSWSIATKKVSAEEEAKAAQAAEMDDDLPEEERPNPGRNNVNVENKANETGDREKPNKKGAVQVPTTFNEMFLFNAAVMGFAESGWFSIILDQIDNMVMNVANSARLQEECDVCFLVLNQYSGQIVLSEFRSVMLASLRSLVPKEEQLIRREFSYQLVGTDVQKDEHPEFLRSNSYNVAPSIIDAPLPATSALLAFDELDAEVLERTYALVGSWDDWAAFHPLHFSGMGREALVAEVDIPPGAPVEFQVVRDNDWNQ
ncbi:unnamed protein product, partial [Symbiodinium microadriaticum]